MVSSGVQQVERKENSGHTGKIVLNRNKEKAKEKSLSTRFACKWKYLKVARMSSRTKESYHGYFKNTYSYASLEVTFRLKKSVGTKRYQGK